MIDFKGGRKLMDFNDKLSNIISKYKGNYGGSLEEYLRGVYRELDELEEYLKESKEEVIPSDELFLEILKEGFSDVRYYEGCSGFEKEPVKDHYPKCKYKGFCGTICDDFKDKKEHKKYKKTKVKKGEYGLYKVKRTLEEFIDATRDNRNDEKKDPFTFLENIILLNDDSRESNGSSNDLMRGSNEQQIMQWSDFEVLLKGAWNLERDKKGYTFGIYKIITYILAALIVVPQIMNDKLLSPIKSIKYFGILALVYLIFCYGARIATRGGAKKISDEFKIGKVELLVHLVIIILGFIV